MARIPESTLTDNFRDGDPWDAQTLNKIVAVLIAGINANYEDILEAVMTPGPAGPVGPQGPVGDKGDKGDTVVSVAVGETETVLAGTPASVENVGTPTEAVFNFKIPQGERGLPGSFINSVDKVYVSKQGNDSNDGLTVVSTKLTLNSAVTQATTLFNAGASIVDIIVMDNEEYTITGTGELNLPFYTNLYANNNIINGTIKMSPHSNVYVKQIKGIPTNNRIGVLVESVTVTEPFYLTYSGSLNIEIIDDSNFSEYTFKCIKIVNLNSPFNININRISIRNTSELGGYAFYLDDGGFDSFLKININTAILDANLSTRKFIFMSIGDSYNVDLNCDLFECNGGDSEIHYFTKFTGTGSTLWLGVTKSKGDYRHSIHDSDYDVTNTTILKENTKLTISRTITPFGDLIDTSTGKFIVEDSFSPFKIHLTFEVNSSIVSVVRISIGDLNLNSITSNAAFIPKVPLSLNLNNTVYGRIFAEGELWYADTSNNTHTIGNVEITIIPESSDYEAEVETAIFGNTTPVNMNSDGVRIRFTENRVVGTWLETAKIPTFIEY